MYASADVDALLRELSSTNDGLTSEAVEQLRRESGVPAPERASTVVRAAQVFFAQFRSPATLILIAAAIVSFFLRDATNAAIILTIVVVGAGLGFWQEFSAANALAAL